LDQHEPDGTACDDANPCTASDSCTAGICDGSAVATPAEVDAGVEVAERAGAALITWNLAAGATSSDLLRGLVRALPIGPGGDDEICFPDLAATSSTDADVPLAGDAFWYLVRGRNVCAGAGSYGYRCLHGVPTTERVSAACP
jgi:hypothetical protein